MRRWKKRSGTGGIASDKGYESVGTRGIASNKGIRECGEKTKG